MASLTHAPAFGGFALTSANGITVEDWDESTIERAEFRPRLAGDGGLFSRARISGRRIRVKGVVSGGDEGLRRANEDALLQALRNGRQLLTMWSDRGILCRLDRAVKLGTVKGSRLTVREWEASFRSEWESWRGVSIVTDGPWTLSALPTVRTLPAHVGTARTWPAIVIDNNGAAVTDKSLLLTEVAGGQQLSLQGIEIQQGQGIVIDMWDGRLGDGTASTPRIASVEGDFFTIAAGTTTSIEFAGNFPSPNLDITVQFYPRYWAGA